MKKKPVSDDDLPWDEEWLRLAFPRQARGGYFPTIWLGRVNIRDGLAYAGGEKICDLPTRGHFIRFCAAIGRPIGEET